MAMAGLDVRTANSNLPFRIKQKIQNLKNTAPSPLHCINCSLTPSPCIYTPPLSAFLFTTKQPPSNQTYHLSNPLRLFLSKWQPPNPRSPTPYSSSLHSAFWPDRPSATTAAGTALTPRFTVAVMLLAQWVQQQHTIITHIYPSSNSLLVRTKKLLAGRVLNLFLVLYHVQVALVAMETCTVRVMAPTPQRSARRSSTTVPAAAHATR